LLLAAAAVLLAGVSAGDASDVQRAAIGCLVYGGTYYLLWWILPGFGFGDVRLGFLLGLVLGYLGWPEFLTGLLLAQFLGGLVLVFSVGEHDRMGDRSRLPAHDGADVREPGSDRGAAAGPQAVDGPALVWFEIAEEQNIFPMMPAGKGLSDLIEKWGGADE
jgi:hypothetical protein